MKYSLLLCSLLMAGTLFSQENLVPNPDFEDANIRSLKKMGMLDECIEDWTSATEATADLYSTGVKGDKAGVPVNYMGTQTANSGDRYAGFTAYAKDAKKFSRQYLTIKLSDELEEDVTYCISINVSLSDLSKYAVNGIGIYVSDRKVKQGNTGKMIKAENVVRHRSNKVMQSMDQWETICGTFVGTGEEEYIVIGCFEADAKLDIQKMKKPKGVTGVQHLAAYYYVDDVSVMAITAPSECACTPADERTPDLIFTKKNIASEDEMTVEQKVTSSTVYFASLKNTLTGLAQADLDKLAAMLKANPNLRLEVVGHSDMDESQEGELNPRYADLGKRRADQVVRYLISKGVSEMRIIPKSKESTQPANPRPTPLAKAQNRRVEFVIK